MVIHRDIDDGLVSSKLEWDPLKLETRRFVCIGAESLPCCHSESVRVGTDVWRGTDTVQHGKRKVIILRN